jgi:hypothetical protein
MVTTSPVGASTEPVRPADLGVAAGLVRAALRPLLGADWSVRAADLDWTARQALEHIPDTLTWYAAQLATRARGDLPGPRHGDPSLSIADLLTVTVATANVLAAVATAAPPTARAFHFAGAADPEGWVAMGCDELLIHADDIARGLGGSFEPPAELCERVLRRLFPWAPTGVDPWQGLRWANGRVALDGHERLDASWLWHSAPLAEWDGTIPRWEGVPGRA